MFVGRATSYMLDMRHADDGRVFAWGKGERGQVGLGDNYWYKEAVPVVGRNEELRHERCVAIAAGFNHGSLVTGAACGIIIEPEPAAYLG